VIRWRPTPDEERWLELAARLGEAVPPAALAERTGGWRSTGPLARIALFVLGLVAALLLVGILGVGDEITLLIAGLISALAAEWLTLRKRLHASGIEEGLCVAGFLMIGAWITTLMYPQPGFGGAMVEPVLIVAAAAAGLRRLNAFVTTCAALAFVAWAGSTDIAKGLDQSIGSGMTGMSLGCAMAALALVLGARQFQRPSYDRMLDWLVATLPLASWSLHASASAFDGSRIAGGSGVIHPLAAVLLLVLGTALLLAGMSRRRHAPLWGFLGCVAALAMELRPGLPIVEEAWLIACGLVVLAAGIALDRWLRVPRDGLTSASLTRGESPLDLLQVAGTALLAQRAAPSAATAEGGFEGGGGRFGGGGASDRY
jgi:hypothetical protein